MVTTLYLFLIILHVFPPNFFLFCKYLLMYCLSTFGLSTMWWVMVSSVVSYVLPMQTDLSHDTWPPKHLGGDGSAQSTRQLEIVVVASHFFLSQRWNLRCRFLTGWQKPRTPWVLLCSGRTWAPRKPFSEPPALSVPFLWPPCSPCPPEGKKMERMSFFS